MKNLRTLGTGATTAAFLIVGITGLLLFFGLRGGALKFIHEYIGFVMVLACLVHIYVNFKPFKSYFQGAKGASIVLAAILAFGYIGYDFTLPKKTNWKKGMAYEKLVALDINTALNAFNGNKENLNAFLASKNLTLPQNISIKAFAKQNKISENDLLDAMLK